jgi:cytoskeletal protein RodZ
MSLRGRQATRTGTVSRSPNLESRPLPRDNDNKKLSLFKRWTSRGIAFTGITHPNNRYQHQHQQQHHQQQQQQHLQTQHSSSITTTSTTASTATMVISSPSSSPSLSSPSLSSSSSIVRSSSSSHHKLHTVNPHHHHKHHVNSKQRHHMAKYCQGQHYVSMPATATSSTTTTPLNIMHLMQNDCPNDVLPLILAYIGPHKTAVIGRTNRFWRQITAQESTWRRLCEELYKVRSHFLSRSTISMV